MGYKPSYMEYYFTIDIHALQELKAKKDDKGIIGCIKRYMWLDLPEDEELYKAGNIFESGADALDIASGMYKQ